ncbi:IS110 family transposase [candidate division KSB1 bacterium]
MHKRRKVFKKVRQKVLIVTVDIGKNKHTGYWRCYNGIDCKPFEFSNTRDGFDFFWQKILTAKNRYTTESIIVGYESTGPYGKPLTHYLGNCPVKQVLVNPMHTKRLKELGDNSPLKTDKKDPRVLADIIELGHWLSVVVPTGLAAELRELAHSRESLISLRSADYNRLQNLLSVLFPEFLTVMRSVRTKSALCLLKRYPSTDAIIAAGCDILAEALHNISRGQLGMERSRMLFKAAEHSVGVREGKKSMAVEVRFIIQRILLYNSQIKAKEEMIKRYLSMIPVSHNLLSMKGIGLITVGVIIGEIGDFNAFSSSRALIKFAGLNLYEVSSGEHSGKRRISKRGRHLLRKILFFAAINVIRKDGILHDYYHKLVDNGMLRMKALIAVMRKLLKIIFALTRDKSFYISDYSIKNVA